MHARRRRGPAPPPRIPTPIIAEMAEAFENKPFAANTGEMIKAAPRPPQPPAPAPFVIEPPPWEAEPPIPTLDAAAAQPPPAAALAELKRRNGDDDWPVIAVGPPLKLDPPRPVEIPAVDWEQEAAEQAERDREARERAQRERRAELLQELLAEETSPYPAKPKGSP